MRLRTALLASVSAAAALVALAALAALVACVDLLHSTSDLQTACELDGQTPGCEAEASAPPGTDFCQWSSAEARTNATHACAWLSACEGPLGNDAFGSCMFHALLAYNCAANPSHPVRGTTREEWDCLWKVKSCGDVTACVFPKGVEECSGTGTACGIVGGGAPNNLDVRARCVDGGNLTGENCALWGQTCGYYPVNSVGGVCGGAGGAGDAGPPCTNECEGTVLHSCAGALDVGVDCADNGAGQCGGFASESWAACLPSAPGPACTASLAATCTDGVAKSCPTGNQETVDCLELLQDVRACNAGTLSPSFDWTSPCAVLPLADAGADAAAPCAESCDAGSVVACYRGGTFPLDCAQAGLGACQMVTTDAVHAVCTPP